MPQAGSAELRHSATGRAKRSSPRHPGTRPAPGTDPECPLRGPTPACGPAGANCRHPLPAPFALTQPCFPCAGREPGLLPAPPARAACEQQTGAWRFVRVEQAQALAPHVQRPARCRRALPDSTAFCREGQEARSLGFAAEGRVRILLSPGDPRFRESRRRTAARRVARFPRRRLGEAAWLWVEWSSDGASADSASCGAAPATSGVV